MLVSANVLKQITRNIQRNPLLAVEFLPKSKTVNYILDSPETNVTDLICKELVVHKFMKNAYV